MFDNLKLYVKLAVQQHLHPQPTVRARTGPQFKPEPDEHPIEFSQLYSLGVNPNDGEEMLVGIEYVRYCPDEMAFIRILTGSFSLEEPKQYKRRVKYDKAGNRYIVLSGQRIYLDSKKTKPWA